MILGIENLDIKKPKGPLMSDEEIADRMNAVDSFLEAWDRHLDNMYNLFELSKMAKAGKTDVVKSVFGQEMSAEELATLIRKSNEDFLSGAANTAMAVADIGTLTMAGTVKQMIESIMETTQQLSKKFHKNLRRLKGRKISDEDVVKTRAANLRPFNGWMFRAEIIMKIHAEFVKITANNAYDQMKKICEYCNQLGWRPRGLFKLSGIQQQSAGTAWRERWAVSSEPAGKLGWNAANLQKAIQISEKLLNIRVNDLTVDMKVLKAIEELNKSGMTFKQINKALTAVTWATYHEIGKMVRVVNKFLTKIDADYDEDDER
jgi:hypothetical protein